MPKLIRLTLGALLLFTAVYYPQKPSTNKAQPMPFTIAGVVIDSLSKIPVEFCNFLIFRQRDSSLVSGCMTDSSGRFVLKAALPGKYFAKVSILGYKTRVKNELILSPAKPVVDLDTIKLSRRNISTGTVLITAEKERLQTENDKLIVNVDRSMGNNASEVLENSPLVSVDINGNVSLQGKPGTVIYIDGVPARFSGFQKADDLKLLPAINIDKLELIVNPTVEYNDGASGGIINIITKKVINTRYSGTAGLTGNTNSQLSGSTGLNYAFKNFSAMLYYSRDNSELERSGSLTRAINLTDHSGVQLQTEDSDTKSVGNSAMINLSFRSDDFNMLNTSVVFNGTSSDISRNSLSSFDHNLDELPPLVTGSSSQMSQDQKFLTFNLNYNRTFEEKGKSFNAYAGYVNNSMDVVNFSDISWSNLRYNINRKNLSDNKNRTVLFSTAYSHPLGKDNILRLGYKFISKELLLDDAYFGMFLNSLFYRPDQQTSSRYANTAHYFYATYKTVLMGLNCEAGLSYEYYGIKNEEKINGMHFDKQYSLFLPSVNISRNLGDGQDLSFSYRSDRRYPFNKELNPYRDNSDSSRIFQGNPELNPAITQSFYLGYGFSSKDYFLRTSLFSYSAKDVIEQLSQQTNMFSSLTTYKNIAKQNNFGLSLFSSASVSEWLKLEPSVRYLRINYEGESVQRNGGMLMTSLRTAVSLPFLKFQMEFFYNSSEIKAQTSTKGMFYSNAALKALFFDKQLSVTLKANDVFNTRNLDLSSFGSGFTLENRISQRTRIFQLDISYYFQGKALDIIENRPDEERGDDF